MVPDAGLKKKKIVKEYAGFVNGEIEFCFHLTLTRIQIQQQQK